MKNNLGSMQDCAPAAMVSAVEDHYRELSTALGLAQVALARVSDAQIFDGCQGALPCHVVVLDAQAAEGLGTWPKQEQIARLPEIVLVGAPSLVAVRFRGRGLSVIAEVADWNTQQIADLVLHALRVRRPLRAVANELVGQLPLRDALSLLRHTMLTNALSRSPSKRSSAKVLGVTRPAVQSMVRAIWDAE
jgi:hypothetical protein